MNCQHCNKYMFNYYDGDLSLKLKLEIDLHLDECPSCRFQYDLTNKENQVLRDASDIPALSPDFNQRIMDAIMPEKSPSLPDNIIIMENHKRFRFKWSSFSVTTAVAVLLLVLCFYVPGILPGHVEQQKIAQINRASNFEPISGGGEATMKLGSKDEQKDDQAAKEIQTQSKANTYGDIENNDAGLPSSIYSSNDSHTNFRFDLPEAGRSARMSSSTSTLPPVSSYNLKNIPAKFKLVNQVNAMENQIDYSYQTDDGSEKITIQLNNSPNEMLEAKIEEDTAKAPSPKLPSLTAPAGANTNSVNREIKVGDQKISLVLSGNISNDELNALADQIEISKN